MIFDSFFCNQQCAIEKPIVVRFSISVSFSSLPVCMLGMDVGRKEGSSLSWSGVCPHEHHAPSLALGLVTILDLKPALRFFPSSFFYFVSEVFII